jgi:hypothetical protein
MTSPPYRHSTHSGTPAIWHTAWSHSISKRS